MAMSFAAAGGLKWQVNQQEDQMAQTESKTRIRHIGTVMVPVTNQDKALDFYTDKLGFEKRTDTPYGEGDRWIEVAPPGAETTVALVPPREGEDAGIQTRTGFTTEDIDGVHAELRDKGVDVDPEVMRMGEPVPPMFFFRDPDGNNFLLVEEY
jgi:catechol 2,3-dioxygenase-like lactoylglutathione lyase family enzyme